jgi:hypothetical protein
LKTEQRAGVLHELPQVNVETEISADTNDARFTDADFAEIEAFANSSVLV